MVVGGLITVTLLTLLVLPSLYPVVMEAKFRNPFVRDISSKKHQAAE